MNLFANSTEVEGFLWGRPIETNVGLILIAVIIAATFFLYRRERGVKRGWRYSLTAVRVVLILLVVAALFEPSVAIKETLQ